MRCHIFHRRRLWPTSYLSFFSPFHTLLLPSPGRVKLARHCRSGKLAAVKILDLHPALSSRASALANAGDKAEKMILTAEREIAVMKVRWPLILSTLSTPGSTWHFTVSTDPISSFSRPITAPRPSKHHAALRRMELRDRAVPCPGVH